MCKQIDAPVLGMDEVEVREKLVCAINIAACHLSIQAGTIFPISGCASIVVPARRVADPTG
jgi:hypothetical protein